MRRRSTAGWSAGSAAIRPSTSRSAPSSARWWSARWLASSTSWAATAEGRLALILLLDQFCRNIHRGSAMAFAGDKRALKLFGNAGHDDRRAARRRRALRPAGPAARRGRAGAVMKHSKDFNLIRECVLSTGLDPQTPGLDLQRACGTSLEAAILVGNKIALGPDRRRHRRRRRHHQRHARGLPARLSAAAAAVVPRPQLLGAHQALPRHPAAALQADLPRRGRAAHRPVDGPELPSSWPRHWQIPRAAQDELAYASHMNAARAWKDGFNADLVSRSTASPATTTSAPTPRSSASRSSGPSFDPGQGTLTAGNSTPLTDGASAVLLASEDWARARNLPVQAWLSYGKAWAVDFASGRDGLLMAPAYAVPAMLDDAQPRAAGLRLLRDPRGLRRAGAVHARGLGVGRVLPRAPRARARARRRSTARSSTSRAAASPTAIRSRPPARASSRRSPSCSRTTPAPEARPDLGLHRRRHGRHRDPRTLIR
jgi:hypothetical protein